MSKDKGMRGDNLTGYKFNRSLVPEQIQNSYGRTTLGNEVGELLRMVDNPSVKPVFSFKAFATASDLELMCSFL